MHMIRVTSRETLHIYHSHTYEGIVNGCLMLLIIDSQSVHLEVNGSGQLIKLSLAISIFVCITWQYHSMGALKVMQ